MYISRFLIILAIMAVFTATAINAKTYSRVLSLHDAILLAVRKNPSIRSGEIQRIADKYALEKAKYAFQPQFNLAASATYSNVNSDAVDIINSNLNNLNNNKINPSTNIDYSITPEMTYKTIYGTSFDLKLTNPIDYSVPNRYLYNLELSFTVTQPLLRGFGRTVAQAPLTHARMAEHINRLNLKTTIINAITQVIKSYNTVISDQQNLKITQQAVKNDEKTAEIYKAEIKAGRKAPADIADLQATLYNDKLDIVTRKNQLAIDKQNLLILLGLNPKIQVTLKNSIGVLHYKAPKLKESLAIVYNNNIAYQQQLINYASLQLDLLTSQDNARWELDLTGAATFGGGINTNNNSSSGLNGIFNGKNYSRSVMLNLKIPFFDKTLEAGIVNARVALAKQQIDIKLKRWELETAVINNIRQLKTDLESIKLAELRAKYARKTYDITLKKVLAGRSSSFELTTKSTRLTQARQSVVSAKINFLNNYASFDALLGTTLKTWHLNFIL